METKVDSFLYIYTLLYILWNCCFSILTMILLMQIFYVTEHSLISVSWPNIKKSTNVYLLYRRNEGLVISVRQRYSCVAYVINVKWLHSSWKKIHVQWLILINLLTKDDSIYFSRRKYNCVVESFILSKTPCYKVMECRNPKGKPLQTFKKGFIHLV